jgi:hypothetical protein
VHGLIAHFFEVIALAIESLYPCNDDNCGVDHLDDNSQVISCCDCVGCFDGSCNTCADNADGSLMSQRRATAAQNQAQILVYLNLRCYGCA